MISEKDAVNILLDKYSSDGERFIPVFLSILKTNLVTSARLTRIYFNQWNFNMDAGNVAPSIFYLSLKNFLGRMILRFTWMGLEFLMQRSH